MLKNLSLIALLGIASVGIPSELCAKSVKVAGTQKGMAAKSITRQVAQQNVTIEFYSPSIVRILKSDAGLGAPVQKKSYSVILKPQQLKDVQIQKNGDIVNIKSSLISVELNQQTGKIRFLSKDGKLLLTDTKTRLDARKDEANKGKYRIEQDFRLADDEAIYGLGQLRDVYMNQRGRQNIVLWNNNTYIAIPYFTSEKGYGLYWDNAGKTYFNDIVASKNNSNQPSCTSFTSEVGTCADYYFMYKDGTQDGVIASIRELTGQATMFPKWAMGFWQCRERYKTSDELAGVLDKYRELKIPTDAIVQDWQYWGCDSNWNAMKFQNPYYINKVGDPAYAKYLPTDMKQMKAQREPRLKSPEEMVKYVHKNDAHLMISIWASFGPWTEQYRELKKMNALLPFETWPRNSGVMPYDVFNPKARNLYWKYLTHLYQMGFDAWWTDSTEPDHFEKPGDENYQTFDGSWLGVKNAFPLLHNKSIYEHQRAMKGNTKRSLQMTRSGSLGIQHYGTICWSGDVVASWDEMKNQIPSGLNFSLCGIPFWNTDLGGFFYWEFEQNPKNPALQELQTRWMQWGTFMPLMRNHCSSPMMNEIDLFGKEGDWAYDAQKRIIELRYRLLPYIYSLDGAVVQEDGTMMRPLVMDFANDRKAILLDDEYMFGKNILVCPVTEPLYTKKVEKNKGVATVPDVAKASAPVKVYLPKGTQWIDFWTNETVEGGQEIQRECPVDILPLYIKAGSILPLGPKVQYATEKKWDNLDICVYPGANGEFVLYEDEFDNYNYEKGMFSTIKFSWDDASRTLTISDRNGEYPKMLKRRNFRITLMQPGKQSAETVMVKADKKVAYSGKKLVVKL